VQIVQATNAWRSINLLNNRGLQNCRNGGARSWFLGAASVGAVVLVQPLQCIQPIATTQPADIGSPVRHQSAQSACVILRIHDEPATQWVRLQYTSSRIFILPTPWPRSKQVVRWWFTPAGANRIAVAVKLNELFWKLSSSWKKIKVSKNEIPYT